VTAPAEQDRVVVIDRFPVTATAPDGTVHHKARLLCTRPTPDQPGWMWLWTDTRPEPTLVHLGPWDRDASQLSGNTRTAWHIATPDGTWRIDPGAGCGCGSPLKRLVPWTPMRRSRL
jgi:hypothetical protein